VRIIKYTAKIMTVCFALVLAALVLPTAAGLRPYAVISPSMSPQINAGAVVYVKDRTFDKLAEGDVITYRPEGGGTAVTHRIIRKDIKEKAFYTKGDANAQVDAQRVKYENVIGAVRLSVPLLGYAALYLNGPEKKIAAAGFLVWLLVMETAAADMIKMEKEAED